MQSWYAEQGGDVLPRDRWASRHWDAKLAHSAVQRAIKRGDLTPQPCSECGAAVSLAHHDDYERRLEVRWLCDRHHRLWHIDHPIAHEVPAPEPQPKEARSPARGKRFHRYLRPRAINLRERGFRYREIAAELKVSVATAFAWCKDD
jgi:ribosomal protein S27AE